MLPGFIYEFCWPSVWFLYVNFRDQIVLLCNFLHTSSVHAPWWSRTNLGSTQDRKLDRRRRGSSFQFRRKAKAGYLTSEGHQWILMSSSETPFLSNVHLDSLLLEFHYAEQPLTMQDFGRHIEPSQSFFDFISYSRRDDIWEGSWSWYAQCGITNFLISLYLSFVYKTYVCVLNMYLCLSHLLAWITEVACS